ncbi:MAG: DUF4054 domain-containing protein [Hyphomicrobium sp.]|nr:DUF4054 domain-containing protein [Hyphomicrobium sp.]
MTSLELYRALIPGHVLVPDQTVELYLTLSAQQHDPLQWGAVFAQAMVWHAAHSIEKTPGSGSGSSGGAGAVGPLISQKDGDLSRTYAAPASSSSGSSGSAAADLSTTTYGARYLGLLRSRSTRLPFVAI